MSPVHTASDLNELAGNFWNLEICVKQIAHSIETFGFVAPNLLD
jgi:hypothetical protein